jgi:hypothetical protein
MLDPHELKRQKEVERVLNSELLLKDKYIKLQGTLTDKELYRLQARIEEVEDNRINLVDQEPENITRAIESKWRTLYYIKDKYVEQLRMILCSKLIHIMWEHGTFKRSLEIIAYMKLLDEDKDWCLNYKTSSFIYNGVKYVIFPEMPDILEKAFQANSGLLHAWSTFDKLFRIGNVECKKHDTDTICICYRAMFNQLHSNFIRTEIYFPTCTDIIY